jgi:hypothetical protein
MRWVSGRGLRVAAGYLLCVSSVCLVGDADVEMVLVGAKCGSSQAIYVEG